MLSYLVRRLAYAFPILLGVNLITFFLFFFVNPIDAMARRVLGEKNVTQEAIEAWKREHGYNLPRLYNAAEPGLSKVTQTIFWRKSMSLLRLDFGRSDRTNAPIGLEIRRRMWPSLMYAIPTFLMSVFVEIVVAMLVAYYRGTALDSAVLFFCVIMLSVAAMFYIIGGQFFFGIFLKVVPISGYQEGFSAARFLAMPILIGIVGALGGAIRFNRTVFLEEIGKDYVRTARAKGLSEQAVLFIHVLKNAMIPILTSLVFAIPFLFMGSLLTESFFSIPGLGGYTVMAFSNQDFAIVRAMVFLGSILYIVSQILTDLSYTLVDPRVRLDGGGASSSPLAVTLGVAVLFALPVAALKAWEKAGPALGGAWNPYAAANAGAILAVAAAAWFVATALPREPWRTAWRQLRHKPYALAALALLFLYGAVGFLDSISWRDPIRDEQGHARRETNGSRLLEAKGKSLLDRLWLAAVGDVTERTYSSPLATHQFSRDLVQDKEGKSSWVTPLLEHPRQHLLGTDKVGNDVLYQCLKGIRTGLVIGGMTILIAIPFAIAMGVLAGYFGGWVDDIIQYVYTTIASIPGILLIFSFVLIFGRGLFQLSVVLGITSWTSLCRLVRAETIKLRELEYVQAASIQGASRTRILASHIVPNLMHLVTISAVLSFSGLVLYETVLTYLGVGVGIDVGSWGNMINNGRLELSREPAVWWNLLGSFLAMFFLVLPANLFGDALRDALDPRLRQR